MARQTVRRASGLLAVVVLLVSPLAAGVAAADTDDASEIPPGLIVLLIDESGSLSEQDVAAEISSAGYLALADPSGNSQIAVVGFGSSNTTGQNAVQEYCAFTPSSGDSSRLLSACLDKVHPRSIQEGNDTDHAAALEHALELLEGERASDGSDYRKVVFLFTDGVLDVHNSPSYGSRDRDEEAWRIIEEDLLPRAEQAGIQVWPLGFGSADIGQLQRLAGGSAPADPRCSDPISTTPSAQVVTDLNDLDSILLDALAGSTCGDVEESTGPPEVNPGETVVRTLEIPPIATDVTITAIRGDARVTIEFLMPNGSPAPRQGSVDGQVFNHSTAETGTSEVLRVTDPIPGSWKVSFTAPEGLETQFIGARALWVGAVTALIDIDPQAPRQGSELLVELRLRTRREIVLDADTLEGLAFTATAQLENLPDTSIALRDDGMSGDRQTGDGVYSGFVSIADDYQGDGQIVGTVSGRGLIPDSRPVFFRVDPPTAPIFDVGLEIDPPTAMAPGESITGTVSAVNEGDPRRVRIGISDSNAAGANLELLEPLEFDIPSGVSDHSFTLQVGEGTADGQVSLKLQARTLPDQEVVASRTIVFDVSTPPPPPPPPAPPSFWAKHWWKFLFGFILLGAALIVARILQQRNRIPINGIAITAVGENETGGTIESESLKARRKHRHQIAFISRNAGGSPELKEVSPKAPNALIVRATRNEGLTLNVPKARPLRITLESPIEIGEGLSIVVRADQKTKDRILRSPNRSTPSIRSSTRIPNSSSTTTTTKPARRGPEKPDDGYGAI
ncbi:VWA domain-containing protein [bacterium]|nr:VWA domain-containing protein [bacterium]